MSHILCPSSATGMGYVAASIPLFSATNTLHSPLVSYVITRAVAKPILSPGRRLVLVTVLSAERLFRFTDSR